MLVKYAHTKPFEISEGVCVCGGWKLWMKNTKILLNWKRWLFMFIHRIAYKFALNRRQFFWMNGSRNKLKNATLILYKFLFLFSFHFFIISALYIPTTYCTLHICYWYMWHCFYSSDVSIEHVFCNGTIFRCIHLLFFSHSKIRTPRQTIKAKHFERLRDNCHRCRCRRCTLFNEGIMFSLRKH